MNLSQNGCLIMWMFQGGGAPQNSPEAATMSGSKVGGLLP